MAKTKKMDESSFAKQVKELNAFGELIRACQDEKQAVLKDYEKESKRYKAGKISEKTLQSSAQKTNKELKRLDNKIRTTIKQTRNLAEKIKKVAKKQSPKSYRVRSEKIKLPKKKKVKKRRK